MGQVPAGLAAWQAKNKKGPAKANDSKTAPTRGLPADDSTPDPNDPAEPSEVAAGEKEPTGTKASAASASNAFGGFKLHEPVIVPALNNALGHILQLTNHNGKPVAEVKLKNGHADWFTLKEIAAVPSDPVPATVPNADPSMGPAAPASPVQTASV